MTRYVFEERNGLMVPVSETRGVPEPAAKPTTELDRDIAEMTKWAQEWGAKIAHQQMKSYCYGEGFYDDDEPA